MVSNDRENIERRIKFLRNRAEEVRTIAADMRHLSARATLVKIAVAYDDLADVLEHHSVRQTG